MISFKMALIPLVLALLAGFTILESPWPETTAAYRPQVIVFLTNTRKWSVGWKLSGFVAAKAGGITEKDLDRSMLSRSVGDPVLPGSSRDGWNDGFGTWQAGMVTVDSTGPRDILLHGPVVNPPLPLILLLHYI